jgi:hypothetical protein
MSEWISVKDRLPEQDGKYLLLVQKRHSIGTFYNGYFYKSTAPKRYYKSWLTENKRYVCVTHWMALPDLPKE